MKQSARDLRSMFRTDLKSDARANKEPIHRSFLKWYVRTGFGVDAMADITDGPSDGGIDAIVTETQFLSRNVQRVRLFCIPPCVTMFQ